MSIYAVADLHLSLAPGIEKPMDIYGPRWFNHVERLRKSWCAQITDQDTVIIAGDISWGLKLNEAKYDLDWVDSLPGHKVIFKGNHDLWWSGISRLNRMYESITFVQNDFYPAESVVICGTRGWLTPDNEDFTSEDEKIYKRELLRLENSLSRARKFLEKEQSDHEILGVMHFPPVSKLNAYSGFQRLFEEYGVKKVLYGHVHGEDGFRNTIQGVFDKVDYQLISLDYLNCRPVKVL
ncbi:MAG: metallophosphoesterase [Clostridiales bacterium]|nr:metallophosphoesterase [Clostridiales bacterium]